MDRPNRQRRAPEWLQDHDVATKRPRADPSPAPPRPRPLLTPRCAGCDTLEAAKAARPLVKGTPGGAWGKTAPQYPVPEPGRGGLLGAHGIHAVLDVLGEDVSRQQPDDMELEGERPSAALQLLNTVQEAGTWMLAALHKAPPPGQHVSSPLLPAPVPVRVSIT